MLIRVLYVQFHYSSALKPFFRNTQNDTAYVTTSVPGDSRGLTSTQKPFQQYHTAKVPDKTNWFYPSVAAPSKIRFRGFTTALSWEHCLLIDTQLFDRIMILVSHVIQNQHRLPWAETFFLLCCAVVCVCLCVCNIPASPRSECSTRWNRSEPVTPVKMQCSNEQ